MPIKVTPELRASLQRDLTAYDDNLARKGGKPSADPERLIDSMLQQFIETDREVAKARGMSAED